MSFKILTHEDLRLAIHDIDKRHRRSFFWMRLCLFVVMAVALVFADRRIKTLQGEQAKLQSKIATLQSELQSKSKSLESVQSMMTVSINGKRMTRPVHLQGDMIVSFIGDIKP